MEGRESTANARLLAKLKDKGISQRKFAAMIGMSTNGFHAIAKGETRVSKVLALAAQSLLGISAEWILNGEGDSEINPINSIDPWDRLLIDSLNGEDSRVFEVLIGKFESSSSPYRNNLDVQSNWSEPAIDEYRGLLQSLIRIMREFSGYESDTGQAPFRCGLMIIAGFDSDEIHMSHAGKLVDQRFKKKLARITEIRDELNLMTGKSKEKNGDPERMSKLNPKH